MHTEWYSLKRSMDHEPKTYEHASKPHPGADTLQVPYLALGKKEAR